MSAIDEFRKTGVAIEATVKIIDQAMPRVQDLSPEYDYAQWAPLFLIAYSGLENGIKVILLQQGITHPHGRDGHNLARLFQLLKKSVPVQAKMLDDAFSDVVNLYTIDKKRWVHFRSLDSYLGEYGKPGRYETFRYWGLENRDLEYVPLFVHRELLAFLERLCWFGKATVTSQRVEDRVRGCFVNAIEEHISACDRCRKDCSKPWLKILNRSFSSRTPYSDKLKGVNSQDFDVVENVCLNQVIDVVLGWLKESDDPAVRYFIQTLSDLPPGSVPKLCDVELEVDERGLVKIRDGEEHLGLLTHRIDGRWLASSWIDQQLAKFAKTKADAMNWLANQGTELVEISVDRGPYTPRRAMAPVQFGGAVYGDGTLEPFRITFIGDSHGLSVGQHIIVRLSHRKRLPVEGIITHVNGRLVEYGY